MTEGAREQGRGIGKRSHRTAAWLAWSGCTLTGVLLTGAVAFSTLSDRFDAYDGLFAVAVISCTLVGALIASRRPANAVGWILLGGTVCLALQEFAREYTTQGLLVDPGSLPLVQPMGWLLGWVYGSGVALLLGVLPLYFAGGRLPAPDWK